jgi:hypothetical protein
MTRPPYCTDMDTVCPFCDQHHEAATAARDRPDYPEDGDATLCFNCGAFCIFDSDSDGGLRKPTKVEQRSLDSDCNVQEIITAWKATRRQ